MTEVPDRLDHWLVLARAGDDDAYRRFLGEAAERLRGFLARRLDGEADLEDIVQQCLIALHEKRETLDPQRPVGPWMYAIARYKLADHLRRRYRRGRTVPLDNVDAPEESHAAHDVHALLARLPEGQAEAIRLTRLEGLTTKEASRRAGIGLSALKVRVHRGIARLRQIVRDEPE